MGLKGGGSAKNFVALAVSIAMIITAGHGCMGAGDNVETITVQAEPLTLTVSGSGKLEAFQPSYVCASASGPIEYINFRDGDRVQGGEVLAGIERGQLEREVMEARSNYLTQASMGDLFAALFSDLESLFGMVNSSMAVMDYYRSSLLDIAEGYREDIAAILPQLPPALRDAMDGILNRLEGEYDRLLAEAPTLTPVASSGYPRTAAEADAARSELAYVKYQESLQMAESNQIVATVPGNVYSMPMGGLLPEDLLPSGLSSDIGGFTSSLNIIAGGPEGLLGDMAFDLIVPELKLEVGSRVEKGRPVFMIVDLSHMLLRLKVEEADICMVAEGQEVDICFDALPRRNFEGEVVYVGSRPIFSLSDTSRYEVEVEVEAPGEQLRLGYTAYADIRVVEEERALILPLEAVVMDPYPHVFVVEEGVACLREVLLGREIEDRVEILEGLEAGEEVVVGGARELKEGDRV